jgi:uncharacterized membrane protein
MRTRSPTAAALLLLLAACSPERGPQSGEPAAAPPAAGMDEAAAGTGEAASPSADGPMPLPALGSGGDIEMDVQAWNCDNGMYIVTQQLAEEDRLALHLPGGAVTLEHQEAASGARYSDGSITFWSKGAAAMLELADRTTAACNEDPRRSRVEAAKLSGADWWAAGNEPGWSLHVFADRLVLVTDYGETTIQTPTPAPVEDGGTVTYAAETEAHDLEVVITEEECADDMSGERFPARVEVTLDGQVLRGCGERLSVADEAPP